MTKKELERKAREAIAECIYPSARALGQFRNQVWLINMSKDPRIADAVDMASIRDISLCGALARMKRLTGDYEFSIIALQSKVLRVEFASEEQMADYLDALDSTPPEEMLRQEKDNLVDCYSFMISNGEHRIGATQRYHRDPQGRVRLDGELEFVGSEMELQGDMGDLDPWREPNAEDKQIAHRTMTVPLEAVTAERLSFSNLFPRN